MSIKISATSTEKFAAVEEAIVKLDDDFVKLFEKAEFLIEGFSNTIHLSARWFNRDIIELPKGFVISGVKIVPWTEFEKSNGEVTEREFQSICINGSLNDQEFQFTIEKIIMKDIQIQINRH